MKEVQSHARLLSQEIEAHQKTHQQLEKAKEVAESANKAKSRYLAGISHELRTPLNILLGYAQLLSQDDELPEEKREYAQILKRNGEHLTDLLEGLLEISKIEAGRLELQRDEVNLKALLQQLAEMFQLQAQRKGIGFNYQISPFVPDYVAADKQRLRQILINLLNNAIKFTCQGQVSLSVSYRNQVTRFSVEDTGIGISAEDQKRIFQPFERVKGHANHGVRGTGLGLTLSNSFAELMGGEITCHSEPGAGSCFTLSLLLPQIEQPESNPELLRAKVIGYTGERRSILVVDDEAPQRKLIQHLLTPLGFEVTQAGSGQECLSLIKGQRFDLFLLDIQMPDMTGWQLIHELRAQQVHQPLIILSANTAETEYEQMAEQSHDDFISKPFALETLLGKLEQHMMIEWIFESVQSQPEHESVVQAIPVYSELVALKELADIGFMTAFSEKLAELATQQQAGSEFVKRLKADLTQCHFEKISNYLDELIHECSTE